MLEVEGLSVTYGAVPAVRDVTFRVTGGEIVTLIGANAAGKTSTLNAISGVLRPSRGTIRFKGRPITGLPAYEVARLGIAHIPEGREVFPDLTVAENLEMGAFRLSDPAQIRRNLERVFTLFPILHERRTQLAGTLSGGEQQMLAIGRGLMSDPELILMDEPSMGLAPIIVNQIFNVIREINREGATILLVEQNARKALSLAHRGLVMESGSVVLSGTGDELAGDSRVRTAYLGV